MKQLSLFDPVNAPKIGTWHNSVGKPIPFDQICRDYVNKIVLVDRYRQYQAVRILEVIYYDHDDPRNKDESKGFWCRRIIYNDGGRDNSFFDEYDKDKDCHFFTW